MEEQLKQSIFLHLCNNLKKKLLQPFILKNKLENDINTKNWIYLYARDVINFYIDNSNKKKE
jgi:hypothetical protein